MNLTKKRILVTGAEGFIGSHLVESLLNENCQIRAFTYYNSFNSWGWLDTFSKDKLENIEIIAGDIRDPNGVKIAVKGIDIVFHLAALIAIPFSYHSPDSYIDTNIKGTLNVLQACRDYNIERVVVTSTSEVYGTAQYVPIDEKHPFQGQSPYSASKIGADKIAESFFCSFKTPVVIARPFNTYGPRQSARAIIPTIITQLSNSNENILLGSLHPTRDFNYIRDICKGLILLAKFDEAIGKEVNIGSNTEISMGALANMLIKLSKANVKIVSEDLRKRPDKSEVERLVCNNSLMKEITGWEPETSLKEGLMETIEWFKNKENLKRYKGDIYNI
jgi:NAD dependent epimerase/dehydratase